MLTAAAPSRGSRSSIADWSSINRRPRRAIPSDRSYGCTLLPRSAARLGQSEHPTKSGDVGELHRKRASQETAELLARDQPAVIILHHGDTTFELPFDVAGVFAPVRA